MDSPPIRRPHRVPPPVTVLSPVRLPPSRRKTATTARPPTTAPPADRIRPLRGTPIAEPVVRQAARPIDRPAETRLPPEAIPCTARPTPVRATPPGQNDGVPAAAPQAATTIQEAQRRAPTLRIHLRAVRPRPGAPPARFQPTRLPTAVHRMAAARDPTAPRLPPTDMPQAPATCRIAPPVRPSEIDMQVPPPGPAQRLKRHPSLARERPTYRARPAMPPVARATIHLAPLPINRRPKITPPPATRQAAPIDIGPAARAACDPWAPIPVVRPAARAPLKDTSCR